MSRAALSALLDGASVLLVAGPGGVGKTTVAAALAVTAARDHDRRVLLVTVDPARRLADALGVSRVPAEPVLVPVGPGPGRLFALMVDMGAGWDALVNRFSTSETDRDALLANPLYVSLTTRFVQSHDYIALDRLATLGESERYDLVVVDTPPSGHAIDILDAPEKMVDFFDSRLLRWLTAPYRSRLASVGARPFLTLAERLLGGAFLARIGEFFWLFSRMQPGIVGRAQEVRARLDDPATRYVLVTTAEPGPRAQTEALHRALRQRDHPTAMLVHNRAAPGGRVGVGPDQTPHEKLNKKLNEVVDDDLRAAMAALVGDDERLARWWAEVDGGRTEPQPIEWRAVPPASVEALASLLTSPAPSPS